MIQAVLVGAAPSGRVLPEFAAVLLSICEQFLPKPSKLAGIAWLLASISAVNGSSVLAQNQPAPKLFGDARDCPPGHRIEFVLPAATIYVDPRWLGSMTILDLKEQKGPPCPTGPIKRASIELGQGILHALDLHRGIGTRLMRFGIGGYPNDPQSLIPESDSERQRSAAWIEDNTIKSTLTRSPDTRSYRLNYPASKG